MTTPDYLRRLVIPAAFALLPPEMGSEQATALLMAIAHQESGCTHRRQVNGPARGWWQFEVNGVRAVMANYACVDALKDAVGTLGYPFDATTLYIAIEHNDVLAAILARLLLWSEPHALPPATAPDDGWNVYVASWGPGAVKAGGERAAAARARWTASFAAGWQAVTV